MRFRYLSPDFALSKEDSAISSGSGEELHIQKASGDERGAEEESGLARVRWLDLLLVVVLTVGALFLAGVVVGDPDLTIGFVLAMLLLQSAISLGAIYIVIVRRRRVRWAALGLRAAAPLWHLRALLVALLSVPLIGIVNYLVQSVADETFTNPQLEFLAPSGFSWFGLAGMLIMAGIVAPIVEEIVFRGLLYGWLRERIGAGFGIWLSALAFSGAHGILLLVPALALQGAILAYLYEKSGSLWPPILVHGTFNMVMTGILYAALAAGISLE